MKQLIKQSKEVKKVATKNWDREREIVKAIFSSIEYITQRYGVSWSGEARLKLIELQKKICKL